MSGPSVYQDADGTVLWRDQRGATRKAGTVVLGGDQQFYIILRVVTLTSGQAESSRILVEAVA